MRILIRQLRQSVKIEIKMPGWIDDSEIWAHAIYFMSNTFISNTRLKIDLFFWKDIKKSRDLLDKTIQNDYALSH